MSTLRIITLRRVIINNVLIIFDNYFHYSRRINFAMCVDVRTNHSRTAEQRDFRSRNFGRDENLVISRSRTFDAREIKRPTMLLELAASTKHREKDDGREEEGERARGRESKKALSSVGSLTSMPAPRAFPKFN